MKLRMPLQLTLSLSPPPVSGEKPIPVRYGMSLCVQGFSFLRQRHGVTIPDSYPDDFPWNNRQGLSLSW